MFSDSFKILFVFTNVRRIKLQKYNTDVVCASSYLSPMHRGLSSRTKHEICPTEAEEGGERVKFNSTFYTSSKEVKLGSARKQSITWGVMVT